MTAPCQYEDNTLYFIKSKAGAVNVGRYLAKYDLFYAVGDSIGYFPADLIVGRPVPLDGAFAPGPAEDAR